MKSGIAFVLVVLGIFLAFSLLTGEFKFVPEESNSEIFQSSESSFLSIPSLEITVPVVFINSRKEDDIQEALESGVVHYFSTAMPGQFGNVYIVGHSSDYPWSKGDYKTIFATLPDIEMGGEIKITFEGEEYIYKVIETKIVEADDLSVLDQPSDQKLLTLQTSYPVGTILKRFVVIASINLLFE